jgi:hypothetical protein
MSKKLFTLASIPSSARHLTKEVLLSSGETAYVARMTSREIQRYRIDECREENGEVLFNSHNALERLLRCTVCDEQGILILVNMNDDKLGNLDCLTAQELALAAKIHNGMTPAQEIEEKNAPASPPSDSSAA